MKSFVCFVLAMILSAGCVAAGDCKCNCNCATKQTTKRVVPLRVVRPADVVCGVGTYSVNVTKRVVGGVAQAVTAPFTTPMYVPQRTYYYVPPGQCQGPSCQTQQVSPGLYSQNPYPQSYGYPGMMTPRVPSCSTCF